MTNPLFQQIELILRERFQPTTLQVIDESAQHAGHQGAGAGAHVRVRMSSHLFAGQSVVARHRLVYDALSHWMPSKIHALALELLPVTGSQG